MRVLGAASFATLLAGQAWAHPDHASGSAVGLSHLVLDPFHLSLIALAVGLAYGVRRTLRARVARAER